MVHVVSPLCQYWLSVVTVLVTLQEVVVKAHKSSDNINNEKKTFLITDPPLIVPRVRPIDGVGAVIPVLIAFSGQPTVEGGVLGTGLASRTEHELVLGQRSEVARTCHHGLTDLLELQATLQLIRIRLRRARTNAHGSEVEQTHFSVVVNGSERFRDFARDVINRV